ncbi:leucine-rich repeat-containing protein 71 isoform X1 [Astyanax mexicanus]|uniref:leucine-rich repeat-containing protein 71 isoform X1 n=1 Tax=Astyanax mexicanus TaxID=7994 RepID=UPI0020CB4515|nr:leucine-rich repeat-containing protein 71 isoform X1 [Astyanax mexicanus]
MKKRGERVSRERRGSGLEEEPLKTEGRNIQEKSPAQTIEDYQCSGNVELDFPELCALHGMREIPLVKLKQPLVSSPPTDSGETEDGQILSENPVTTWCPKPCLQVELENEDPQSAKKIIISGWRVDEMMVQVLNKTLPSLSNLQCLKMWRTGITENILTSLRNTIIMCTNLRTVILEGNPIPEQSYHILMGEDSMINHLSLRNNRIGEEGARLIGSALSTVHSANKNLLTLNMAFNCIGDEGAIYISQGLRFNRTLLCLSLANNQIGDTGASSLAEVLGPFALTHEEIIERRQLMVDQLSSQAVTAVSKCEGSLSVPSSSSIDHMNKGSKSIPKKKDSLKKEEKPAASQTVGNAGKKEDAKLAKKDTRVTRSRGGKSGGKDKSLSGSEQEDKSNCAQKTGEEALNPLLDPDIRHADGKVIHPGNNTLISLNLSGNKLTEQSVQKFLSSVVGQDEGGLLHFFLNRNCFPKDCDAFLKILELMSLKDPLNKTSSGQGDEEQGQEA